MQFELTKEYIDNLQEIIKKKDENEARKLMEGLYPIDIAEIYDELHIDEAKFLYLLLDGDTAADVLAELEEDDRERFLKVLTSKIIARKFIDHMDSDDAADVLGDLPEEKMEEVLSLIEDVEQAGDIVDLLHYDEDTAGGLMGKELVAINENATVTACLREIAAIAEEIDQLYYMYVVDDDEILKGVLSLKQLLLSNTTSKVSSLYNADIISVRTEASSEEVAVIMDKYDLVALPVVDSINRLVGRITIDDVVDVIREEAEKDYQMLSGIAEDVEPSDTIWLNTRARLPWLMIGLIGGILGARVIGFYEADLLKHASMAFFIPLIAAMGGNVGVQSSAIVVQGLANKTIYLESTFKKILKEFAIGLLNGSICASIVFIYNMFFSDTQALTVTVSLALLVVIIFASIFGTFVPLALNKFKIDPALATGPFITTVNDILGLLMYLVIGRTIFAMM
jgi:magnesium transporter